MTAGVPYQHLLATVAIDLGRTHCRLTDGRRHATVVRPGGVSLADPDGSERMTAVIVSGLTQLVDRLAAVAASRTPVPVPRGTVRRLAVAASGVVGAPGAAEDLAGRLAVRLGPLEVMVTGDIVAAHAGALDGGPGVVLVAGTGAVALGVAADGTWHRVDGHGPLLDDAGSGFAIGRAGLRAALRHHDGRPGGSAALARAARTIAPPSELVLTLQSSVDAIRDIAAFAPAVAQAARDGDPVASDIFVRAADELAATITAGILATCPASPRVALRGPVAAQHDLVGNRLSALVTSRFPDVDWVDTGHDALDGVLALLEDPDGIHQDLTTRHSGRPQAAATP